MDSKPGGRKIVWLLVAASVALLLVVFIARPRTGTPADTATIGPAATTAEIESSTVPGAADDARPVQR